MVCLFQFAFKLRRILPAAHAAGHVVALRVSAGMALVHLEHELGLHGFSTASRNLDILTILFILTKDPGIDPMMDTWKK
jgi:hypothetical protein